MTTTSKHLSVPHPDLRDWQRHALTVLACAVTTLITTPLIGLLDLANIVMLFLLTVLLVSVTLGLKPALLAAFLSVGLFDFFFVPPRFTFVVNDGQYLVTFAVMLVVAIITGRRQAACAGRRTILRPRNGTPARSPKWRESCPAP